MAATASQMVELGTEAPAFSLPDTHGNTVSLDDLAGAKAYLIAFICNHCPFVKHVEQELGRIARAYQQKGVAVIGICSNDLENYADDRPEKLEEQRQRAGFDFPYLVDADQSVAKAYCAACTPDFFVYDADRKLFYRGQMDDSRPDSGIEVTGTDLRSALDTCLAGENPPREQKPSLGCNIKWKKGTAPSYA